MALGASVVRGYQKAGALRRCDPVELQYSHINLKYEKALIRLLLHESVP